MKRILITGGPTNEYIDEVMKITNMSTGSLSVTLGEYFLKNGDFVCLVLNNSTHTVKVESCPEAAENLKICWVETTEDMLQALESEKENVYDVVIHAAAVGDYKAGFSFLLEDLAEELFQESENRGGFKSADEILKIMVNPKSKLDDSSKISSYQENLTVKLALTRKIIARLREWYPKGILIGCKLLENVPKEELFEAARKLCSKNKMDYILANDLADLRKGMPARYLVTDQGYTGTKLETPADIFNFVKEL